MSDRFENSAKGNNVTESNMAESQDIESASEYPGLRRLPYFLISLAVNIGITFLVGFYGQNTPGLANLSTVVMVIVMIGLIVQRFRNQGASGFWAIGILVPLLNLYVSVRALAYPEGYADHKTFDLPAKIIIALFVLVFILGVVAAIAIPAYQEYLLAAEAAKSAQ